MFTKTEHNQVPFLDRSAPFMEEIVVTKEGITKLLKGLNPSEALGPDELHPRVLKELGQYLPIFSSNRLIQVKSLVNGLLQTFAPCSRRMTGGKLCMQLSPSSLDLHTLQATRTYCMFKYHGSS